MSAGPCRQAVEEGLRIVRERASQREHANDLSRLAEAMSIEVSEAVLRRTADMKDRDIGFPLAGGPVSYALANALAGFLLTAMQGDSQAAAGLLPSALRDIERIARIACANPHKGVITTSMSR